MITTIAFDADDTLWHTERIFLSTKDKFTALDTLIWNAIEESEFNEQYSQIPRTSEKSQLLITKGPEHLKALEADVQGRLWSAEGDAL